MEAYMKVSDVVAFKDALGVKLEEAQTVGDKGAETIVAEVMRYFSGVRVYSEIAPVKHARWEKIDSTGFGRCSSCGHVEEICNGDKELGVSPFASKYCPNCGAKMGAP